MGNGIERHNALISSAAPNSRDTSVCIPAKPRTNSLINTITAVTVSSPSLPSPNPPNPHEESKWSINRSNIIVPTTYIMGERHLHGLVPRYTRNQAPNPLKNRPEPQQTTTYSIIWPTSSTTRECKPIDPAMKEGGFSIRSFIQPIETARRIIEREVGQATATDNYEPGLEQGMNVCESGRGAYEHIHVSLLSSRPASGSSPPPRGSLPPSSSQSGPSPGEASSRPRKPRSSAREGTMTLDDLLIHKKK